MIGSNWLAVFIGFYSVELLRGLSFVVFKN